LSIVGGRFEGSNSTIIYQTSENGIINMDGGDCYSLDIVHTANAELNIRGYADY
jgi:hypothetical protein